MYWDLLPVLRESLTFFNLEFGHFRTFLRVQWQPFEEKFGDISASFAHHLDILTNSAQAQQLGILNKQFAEIRSGFNASGKERVRIQSNEQAAERRQFLEWISDIDYEETFNEIITKRHPGTGEWLLCHERFTYWFNEPTAPLLWCHGKGECLSRCSSLPLTSMQLVLENLFSRK